MVRPAGGAQAAGLAGDVACPVGAAGGPAVGGGECVFEPAVSGIRRFGGLEGDGLLGHALGEPGQGGGECEDFVIGKFLSLVHLGVPAQKMRLIYVRARMGGIGSPEHCAHGAGLLATPQAEPLVLDNLVSSIPAGQRNDLTPVFSFNAQGIYVRS